MQDTYRFLEHLGGPEEEGCVTNTQPTKQNAQWLATISGYTQGNHAPMGGSVTGDKAQEPGGGKCRDDGEEGQGGKLSVGVRDLDGRRLRKMVTKASKVFRANKRSQRTPMEKTKKGKEVDKVDTMDGKKKSTSGKTPGLGALTTSTKKGDG